MTTKYAVYDPETGEIREVRTDSGSIFVAESTSTPLDDTLHMIVDGAVVDRPALAITETLTFPADGVPRVIAADLPADTLVRRNGARIGYTTGDLTLTPLEAGVHEFDLRPPFPYRRAEFVITITEAE
jgi:hypothetical protein